MIYDARNQKLTEEYPDHNSQSSIGDASYDKRIYSYDSVGRPAVFQDQKGDTVTHSYDMAGRQTQRDFRLYVNSPSGTIADSDVLTYDDAGRMLTAVNGRYNNTVTHVYGDQAGRLTSESLTVNFGSQSTFTVESAYDAAGRKVEITYPDDTVVTRSYTARDQLYQVGYDSNTIARSVPGTQYLIHAHVDN